MKTHNNLPLYTLEVGNPESGVDFVALVDRPAIKRGFLAFRAAHEKPMAFTVTNEDRRIVSGPLMLADTPIYRIPPEVPHECYVSFSAKTIEDVVRKFFTAGHQRNVNLMHDAERRVDGVVMFESFITDSRRGVLPMVGYEDAPEGSWFGSFIVNNDEVWQQVKAGQFTGFSVEGFFTPVDMPAEDPDEQMLREAVAILEGLAEQIAAK